MQHYQTEQSLKSKGTAQLLPITYPFCSVRASTKNSYSSWLKKIQLQQTGTKSVFPASPLMALLLFSTGAFTKTTYYNSQIKPSLQSEHRHCKRFAAFSLCVSTKLKTTNSSIQMTLATSPDFGWEIPWKSCLQTAAESTKSRQPSRRLILLHVCAIDPLPLYRAEHFKV